MSKRRVVLSHNNGRVCFTVYNGNAEKPRTVPGLCRRMCSTFGLTFSSCHEAESAGKGEFSKKSSVRGAMRVGSMVDDEIGKYMEQFPETVPVRPKKSAIKVGGWRCVASANKTQEKPKPYTEARIHSFTRKLLATIDTELHLRLVKHQCVVWAAAPTLLATAADVVAIDDTTGQYAVLEIKVCRLSAEDYEGPGGNAPRNLPSQLLRALEGDPTSLAFTHQMQLCNTLHMFNTAHPDQATTSAYVITVNKAGARVYPLWPSLVRHSSKVFGALAASKKKKKRKKE